MYPATYLQACSACMHEGLDPMVRGGGRGSLSATKVSLVQSNRQQLPRDTTNGYAWAAGHGRSFCYVITRLNGPGPFGVLAGLSRRHGARLFTADV